MIISDLPQDSSEKITLTANENHSFSIYLKLVDILKKKTDENELSINFLIVYFYFIL